LDENILSSFVTATLDEGEAKGTSELIPDEKGGGIILLTGIPLDAIPLLAPSNIFEVLEMTSSMC
jgi:hypothetical protein